MHVGEGPPAINQLTVVVPEVVVMETWVLLANPVPVMVRDEPTVPDVTPVSSVGPPATVDSPEIVDRVTVGLAA